jgi:hypothetical protein
MSEDSKARGLSFPGRRAIEKQLNLARFSLLGVEASLYSLVRNMLAREAEPAGQCFPFVLMHGFAGFRELRIGPIELFDYFNGVRTLLGQMGYQVFAPEIEPFNPPGHRAFKLRFCATSEYGSYGKPLRGPRGGHHSVKEQHVALTRRIQGHFNYFGISGNFRSLLLVIEQVKRIWYKWLCRRSQRKRLTWERFADLLRDFPLPRPRIMVRIWGS